LATLVRHRRLATDSWRLLEDAAAALPAAGGVIVPLAAFRARRDELLARAAPVGVQLAANEGPEALAADLGRLALVAVHFPKFADGRGFSTARLLRERHGYAGEIRAVGDVLVDQLLFLERCGFDSFALRDDQDPAAALAAFAALGDAYQGTVAEPRPLFRRRLGARA